MSNDYFYGLGRRKSSTARVRLTSKKGKGTIKINDESSEDYFSDSKFNLAELKKPFAALELAQEDYDVSAKVKGGGHGSQADAVRLGISKAFVEMNEDFKPTLRRAELLGRDPREKERKKFGLKGARKKRQFTKR